MPVSNTATPNVLIVDGDRIMGEAGPLYIERVDPGRELLDASIDEEFLVALAEAGNGTFHRLSSSFPRLPFAGEYEQAVMYSILNEDPEPVTGVRAGLPMELEWILEKALAKDADERYQTVSEMSVDQAPTITSS